MTISGQILYPKSKSQVLWPESDFKEAKMQIERFAL
jgi:hypothetical protein